MTLPLLEGRRSFSLLRRLSTSAKLLWRKSSDPGSLLWSLLYEPIKSVLENGAVGEDVALKREKYRSLLNIFFTNFIWFIQDCVRPWVTSRSPSSKFAFEIGTV